MVINFLELASFQTFILFFKTESTSASDLVAAPWIILKLYFMKRILVGSQLSRKPSTIPNIKLYEPPNLTSKF